MNWRTYLLVIVVCIISASCAHTTNIERIGSHKANNIGVISLFTDEVKGSYGLGMSSAKVYSSDAGWKVNTIVKNAVEQKCHTSENVYLIDFDLATIEKKDVKKYDSLAQAVVGKFLKINQQTDIDLFIVFYPNAIDERGRQYSALMNFAIMGPVGVLIGEHARRTDVFTPIINIFKPSNFESAMGEKPLCQLNYNMYAVDRYSQQIIGQKENVKCKELLESDFWPDKNSTFEELNLTYIKETCLAGISKSIIESLSDIGL